MVEEKKTAVNGMAADHQTVLVLDYGSQYTQLIARRIREFSMFSVLFPGDASLVRAIIANMIAPLLTCVGKTVSTGCMQHAMLMR
jgi:hypothetical protein